MTNIILQKRVCKLIAMTYALDDLKVWNAYEKLGSIDKLLNLAQDGMLEKIFEIGE